MKLFKRRAKPDGGAPAASPTKAIDGASTDEVEPGQMSDTSSVDSTIQSGVEQAGDSEPMAAPAGMFGRLRDGLSRSRSQITDGLATLVLGKKQLDPALMEALEEQLIMADLGLEVTHRVLELLRQASIDPNVLAIKQTLYRTGINSQIVHLLVDAARAGKDVTAVVEIRARFDEEANIRLAARLQEAGVQVVYGIVGHKAHAKMLMIVRREPKGIRRYVHLGTGNYHASTAALYTDLGLLTANPEIGEDVHRVFQELSGLGKVLKMKHLLHSPFTLFDGLIERIKRETESAKQGLPSGIDLKLNSLTEPKVIRALYGASQAGVPVRLLVRGICCLRPGIEGVSENIVVRSLIGRFLEHARVYCFENNGEREVWGSSADCMDRNLFQRVEVAFPILAPALRDRVFEETIELAWKKKTLAWDMQPDGSYVVTKETETTKLQHPQKRLMKKHRV